MCLVVGCWWFVAAVVVEAKSFWKALSCGRLVSSCSFVEMILYLRFVFFHVVFCASCVGLLVYCFSVVSINIEKQMCPLVSICPFESLLM